MISTTPNGIDLFIMAAAAMILITLYIRIFIIEPARIIARRRVQRELIARLAKIHKEKIT